MIDPVDLTAHALGQLSPAERAELDRQLADDSVENLSAREQLASSQGAANAVRASYASLQLEPVRLEVAHPDLPATSSVRDVVAARLEKLSAFDLTEHFELVERSATTGSRWRRTWSRRSVAIAAALAASLFVCLGGLVYVTAHRFLLANASSPGIRSATTEVLATIGDDQPSVFAQESMELPASESSNEQSESPSDPRLTAAPLGDGELRALSRLGVVAEMSRFAAPTTASPAPAKPLAAPQDSAVPRRAQTFYDFQAQRQLGTDADRAALTRSLGRAEQPKAEFEALAKNSSDARRDGKPGEEMAGTRKLVESAQPLAPNPEPHNTNAFDRIVENEFQRVVEQPLSTFSIDVDTASYTLVRQFLERGQRPPVGAVRIEELINYFRYDYPQPEAGRPFSVTTEVADCPWNAQAKLLRIGLKGREIPTAERPTANLVFLVDVSGSMGQPNKLPLVKQSLRLLTQQLREQDRVAIVVYAGSSGLALPSTTGDRKESILQTIDRLEAGGSTNGAGGIQQAYQVASDTFVKGGTNRVILCTDGDFNVGITSQDELTRLIEDRAKTGVFLSALGFGMGNFKDSTLEKLADRGNGNYAYIDDEREARRVLVEQLAGTLITIAKDVKLQLEFNPRRVGAYRLVGYENRLLAKEDFNNDQKDAGEIGAGHSVTALYELQLTGADIARSKVDDLKYQRTTVLAPAAELDELLTVKLRYKQPDGDVSQLIEQPVRNVILPYAQASVDFKFAAAVAGFALVLRDSPSRGMLNLPAVIELATEGLGADRDGYRRAFVELVKRAR